MCCQGAPVEMQPMVSPWAEDLGQQVAGQIGRGLPQGATPMPQDLFGAMMNAYQMPSFSFGPMQYLNEMYGGGGAPWEPPQFNPMDFYQSIYPQQQPTQGPSRMPAGNYARPSRGG